MEPIEYDIEFPRGDTNPVRFRLKDYYKNIITPSATTEIYFTVKTSSGETPYVFQKKYSLGDITLDNDFIIIYFKHTDTTSLKMNSKYRYDIQVKDTDYVKTLYLGTLTLTEEVTHLANE